MSGNVVAGGTARMGTIVIHWVWALLVAASCLAACAARAQINKATGMNFNELTPAEEEVIVRKGTERPFTGEYVDTKDAGTYVCRRCNAPLYRSSDKFDSRCGWPSFDDEIAGAVRRVPDADGRRTEIVCANCGAHLGHVFLGEGFTEKNTRHCVNSISMRFVPAVAGADVGEQRAYFASGCFWGTEYHFMRAKGVKATTVGYMGGHKDHPTYKEVCTGTTGHAETTEVVFDPSVTSYEQLVKLFFETHDFTQVNGQGPDIGPQYRSFIFYTDESQRRTAERCVAVLEGMGYAVATRLVPASKFWKAEDYHQEYYDRKGGAPYCHAYRRIF